MTTFWNLLIETELIWKTFQLISNKTDLFNAWIYFILFCFPLFCFFVFLLLLLLFCFFGGLGEGGLGRMEGKAWPPCWSLGSCASVWMFFTKYNLIFSTQSRLFSDGERENKNSNEMEFSQQSYVYKSFSIDKNCAVSFNSAPLERRRSYRLFSSRQMRNQMIIIIKMML